MSKPKKLTEGHSSGHLEYWFLSNAELEAYIKRLRQENEQLRSLLKDCQPYFETILDFSELGSWREACELFMKIQKEMDDE